MKTNNKTVRLTESAIFIAAAVILSFIKICELPAGGAVTLCSMLPIILIAYRYGILWGMLCGTVYGTVQLVLGASVLSYVTGALSVAAVIVLDYILAFAFLGLAGIFRKAVKNQTLSVILGSFLVILLRYGCHVLSGATVWAGLSIPSADALLYSIIYNATYMVPEGIVLLVVAYWISNALDFKSEKLADRRHGENGKKMRILSYIGGAVLSGAIIYDIVEVFGVLQNEDGVFDITLISSAPWFDMGIVTLAASFIFVFMLFISRSISFSE